MKINGRKSISVGQVGPTNFGTAGETPTVESTGPVSGDTIEISSESRDVGQLKNALETIPPVRLEKIEGIRGQVEEGNYYVESEKLAKRVVDEALEDALYRHRAGK